MMFYLLHQYEHECLVPSRLSSLDFVYKIYFIHTLFFEFLVQWKQSLANEDKTGLILISLSVM